MTALDRWWAGMAVAFLVGCVLTLIPVNSAQLIGEIAVSVTGLGMGGLAIVTIASHARRRRWAPLTYEICYWGLSLSGLALLWSMHWPGWLHAVLAVIWCLTALLLASFAGSIVSAVDDERRDVS